VGETILVDVMLVGSHNYTSFETEIVYDPNLLEFAGYENLHGWAASVTAVPPDKVSVRSIPSPNMEIGESCSPGIRIVTLKFTANRVFFRDRITTQLVFASIAVSPPAGVKDVTVTPGHQVTLEVYQE
jgi:hypothetical protein